MIRRVGSGGSYEFTTLAEPPDDDGHGLSWREVLSLAVEARTHEKQAARLASDPLFEDAWASHQQHRISRSDSRSLPTLMKSRGKILTAEFGGLRLSEMTAARLVAWRDGFMSKALEKAGSGDASKRAARGTWSRYLTELKSALEYGADVAGYTGERAWQRVSKYPPSTSSNPRQVVVTDAEVDRIVAAARPDLRALVRLLHLTGMRVGEATSITKGGVLDGGARVRVNGKTGTRIVTLCPQGRALIALALEALDDGDGVDALLFRQSAVEGQSQDWRDGRHSAPFAEAVVAAGLGGRGIVPYTLRHTRITTWLAEDQIPLNIVSAQVGSSAAELSRTYFHALPCSMDRYFG